MSALAVRIFQPEDDPAEPKPLTVGCIIALWRKYHAGKKWSRGTWLERKRSLKFFARAYGSRRPDDVGPLTIEEWVKNNPDWQSDWTIKRNVDTVRLCFKWAKKSKLIRENPFEECTHPTGENGRDMTPEEFRALVRGTDACFRRVLFFLYMSNARPCEMSSIKEEGITWPKKPGELGIIRPGKDKTRKQRKDKKAREIFLVPCMVKLMAWCCRRAEPGACLLLNSEGKPWTKNALDLRIYRLRHRLGLPPDLKLYGCRHGFATQFLLNGGDPFTLKDLMGHTDIRTTMRYVHLAQKHDHFQAALQKHGPKLGRRESK